METRLVQQVKVILKEEIFKVIINYSILMAASTVHMDTNSLLYMETALVTVTSSKVRGHHIIACIMSHIQSTGRD